MKKTTIVLCLTLAPFISSASIETGARIDWMKGEIRAYSKAAVPIIKGSPVDAWDEKKTSLNAARMDAYGRAREKTVKQITELLVSLRVDPENTIRDILDENDLSRNRLSEIVDNRISFRENPAAFDEAGCEGRLKLADIIDALPFRFPGDDFPTRMDNPIETEYTSLVVDARGLGVKPMLFPSVYSSAGVEIYGKNFIDVSYAARYGMASYAYTENTAMKNKRAGEHPYYTAALRNLRDCPVISERDTRKVLSSRKTMDHLRRCRVIFIIDREK